MMELKKYKLGDLLDIKRGTSLSGEYYSTEGEYVRLTCGNFDYTNNSFKENTSKDNIFYTGNVREEFIMQKGDIITPLTEQAIGLLGSTAIIPESNKYIQSQDVAKIICNETLLYPLYAFYLISSEIVKKQLSAAAQQTKIRHTSPDKIKDCIVWIPELPEQKRIASILSALDKKIALNRQINQNLEALARQLYDYWFVQFDFPDANGKPYKSFGGKMVYNPILKREIPEGWEVQTLQKVSTICRGSIITEAQTRVGSVKVVAAAITYSYLHDTANRSANVITISSSGANAGYMNFWRESIFASDCITVQCEKDIDTILTYHQLELYRDAIMKKSQGSAQPHVYPSDIESLPCICVPDYLKNMVCEFFISYNKQIASNSIEIEALTKQRDELLPLLMNGQVNFDLSDD